MMKNKYAGKNEEVLQMKKNSQIIGKINIQLHKGKKICRKLAAGTLAVVTLATTIGADCYAGAPKVETDEAVYANLDYYGTVDSVSVVKGCTMNGNTDIVDYGNYDDVTNMSNKVKPTIENGKVAWKLPEGTDQFYYECETKDLATHIPWNLDVTYKLNGVETAGEDLAGASGMVTIDIKATPNKNAPEYYRNNLILSCATMVDMSKSLSIDAPGSQLQSVGTYKAVVFMAMPGEEGNFEVNIGTDSFESMGVFFMMVPATLESLDMISDVADVKDTVRDSVDAISDSTDVILDSLQGMKSGLEQVQSGAKSAQEAKATYDSQKDGLKANMDATIDSMYNLSLSLSAMDPHFAEGKRIADDVSYQLNDIAVAMAEGRDIMDKMTSTTNDLQHAMRDLGTLMGNLGSDSNMDALESALSHDASSSALENFDATKIAYYEGMMSADEKEEYDNADAATKQKMLMAKASSETSDEGISQLLEGYQQQLKALGSNPAFAMGDETDELLGQANKLTYKLQSIITQTKALQGNYSNDYKLELQSFLDDMQALTDNTNSFIWAAGITMKNMRNIMDTTEGSVSTALDSSLNGMIGIAGGAISATDGTETLRNAKDVMKNAIDDELDKIEEDTNVLNIDTSLPFPSFTSDKNGTPASIQIIMRTKEISIDDADVDNSVDLEPVKQNIGVWGRVKAVFHKMFGWIGK